MLKRSVLFSLAILIVLSTNANAAAYKVDPNHSTVGFKIRHLFSNVTGRFDKFEGTIDYEPGKPETWKSSGTIEAASINTGVAARDEHLRSADFFDTAQFPQITFKTTKVLESTATTAKLEGLFTMHGVEKPMVLDVDILGEGPDPAGNVHAGFTVKTRLNRKDFGLAWNKALESGQLMVGEEVDITLEIEAILEKTKPAAA